jgi:hypothetical protein
MKRAQPCRRILALALLAGLAGGAAMTSEARATHRSVTKIDAFTLKQKVKPMKKPKGKSAKKAPAAR